MEGSKEFLEDIMQSQIDRDFSGNIYLEHNYNQYATKPTEQLMQSEKLCGNNKLCS